MNVQSHASKPSWSLFRDQCIHFSKNVTCSTSYHFPKLLCNLFVTCYMSSQTQFLACNCPGTYYHAWLFNHMKHVTVYVRLHVLRTYIIFRIFNEGICACV